MNSNSQNAKECLDRTCDFLEQIKVSGAINVVPAELPLMVVYRCQKLHSFKNRIRAGSMRQRKNRFFSSRVKILLMTEIERTYISLDLNDLVTQNPVTQNLPEPGVTYYTKIYPPSSSLKKA